MASRIIRQTVSLFLFFVLLGPGTAMPAGSGATGISPPSPGGISLPFLANDGRWSGDMLYYTQVFGGSVFITREGEIIYSLPERGTSRRLVLKERFVGGGHGEVRAGERSAVQVSSYRGSDPAGWRKEISAYATVELGEVYDNIAVQVRATGQNVEKLFTVAPGGDPAELCIAVEGAGQLRTDEEGQLLANTGLGEVVFTRPVAWQQIDGRRHPVQVAYRVGEESYGFDIGEFDRSAPLWIDPLLASTFVGGGGEETYVKSMVIDDSGDIFLAGHTSSTDFPVTPGVVDTLYNSGGDIFVIRMSGDLGTLEACTYLGGSALEGDYSGPVIALNAGGDVYVAGHTQSADFPVTSGAFDTTYHAGDDMFVAKLDRDFTTLTATYVGGNNREFVEDMEIGAGGDVYVTGSTSSSDFPATPGAYSETYGGGFTNFGDVMVVRLSGDLSTLEAATYVGGSGGESAGGIALDGGGGLFLVGYSWSGNFPTTAGAYDQSSNGGADLIVAHLDTALTTLNASSYVGGSTDEYGLAMSLAADGSIYISGHTASLDFPVSPDAFDTTYNSIYPAGTGDDAFITHIDANLTTVLASTYFGGRRWESTNDMAIDSKGNIYIAGSTRSPNIPITVGAYDESFNGGTSNWGRDAFIARLNDSLTTIHTSTFLGGTGNEWLSAMALDAGENVCVAGGTSSPEFPVTAGSWDETFGGGGSDYGGDIFICRFDSLLLAVETSVGEAELPARTPLLVNEPNPFNPSTTIRFRLPITSPALLSIYDAAGRLVTTLVDEALQEGSHTVRWDGKGADGRDAASGIYFTRLVAGDHLQMQKMVLLR